MTRRLSNLTTYRNDHERAVNWVLPTWAEAIAGGLVIIAALLMLALFAAEAPAAPRAVAIIRAEAKRAHLSSADTAALITLCRRESGYNPRCVTGSCVGLFQVWRTPYANAHAKGSKYRHRWQDPRWNTYMAIKQIRHRYKTPRAALAHSYSCGWY